MPGGKYSLVSKANRREIYTHLFKAGAMVVKKDATLPLHPEVKVPNLHVMLVLRSLKSRGMVQEEFNWGHHFYTLKNEGIEHIREALQLPGSEFPDTFRRSHGERGERDRGDRDRGERKGGWNRDDRPPREGLGRGRGRGFGVPAH